VVNGDLCESGGICGHVFSGSELGLRRAD
jgi:hypothetical protein